MPDESRKITWREACQILGCGKSTLYRLISEGKIRAYGVGSRCRWFNRDEIKNYAKYFLIFSRL